MLKRMSVICLLSIGLVSILPLYCFAGDVKDHAQKTGNMVLVKGGCFQMGDTFGDGDLDEKPVHEVCHVDFYIDRYEVTQGQYRQVMGDSPSHFSSCGDNCPVEKVAWHSARDHCLKKGKRLPTEAEWEYAARSGGKKEKYAGTSGNPDSHVWYSNNAGKKTNPAGGKTPNGLGLYDMSGNVWEWVSNRYAEDYAAGPKDNPQGPDSGTSRVLRGGGWYDVPGATRAANRFSLDPDYRNDDLGFRCAMTP